MMDKFDRLPLFVKQPFALPAIREKNIQARQARLIQAQL